MKFTIKIECGDTTCAPQDGPNKGKLCSFVRISNFGTTFICAFYEVRLFDEQGWLERCAICMEKHPQKKT